MLSQQNSFPDRCMSACYCKSQKKNSDIIQALTIFCKRVHLQLALEQGPTDALQQRDLGAASAQEWDEAAVVQGDEHNDGQRVEDG